MKQTTIIIIVIMISLMVASSIGAYFFMNSDDASSPPSTPPPAPAPPAVVPCNLHCENLGSKFKEFYDTKGEWKNVFTMTPSRYNKVNDTECDVLYTYNPVPGGGRGDTGQDKRRFAVSKGDSCNWTVTSMGGYQSGATL